MFAKLFLLRVIKLRKPFQLGWECPLLQSLSFQLASTTVAKSILKTRRLGRNLALEHHSHHLDLDRLGYVASHFLKAKYSLRDKILSFSPRSSFVLARTCQICQLVLS